MAPKLHTSQIFKGRAYEPKYRAYGFCLNKKRSKFNLAFRSNFFKTWKKILHTWNLQEFKDHSTQNASKTVNSLSPIFLCVTETHAIILLFHMFLWCSFTNSAWSHGINERDGWMIVTPSVANTDFSLKVQNVIICISAGCILVYNSACYWPMMFMTFLVSHLIEDANIMLLVFFILYMCRTKNDLTEARADKCQGWGHWLVSDFRRFKGICW